MRAFATQSTSDNELLRKQQATANPVVSRSPWPGQMEGNSIQRKEACACGGGCARCSSPASSPSLVDNALRHTGRPLDGASRDFFEPRLGQNLENVRVHTDTAASDAARQLRASAFTVGNNIFFAAGQFSPDRAEGRKLLAHELVHTVQQHGSSAQPAAKLEISQPGDALETEADRVAESVASGRHEPVISRSGPKLQRQPAPAPAPAPATTNATTTNQLVVGGFHPYDADAANKKNAALAGKMDMATIQEFLKVPMVMPREGYYFNKDKGGEKVAAKTVEAHFPDSKERAKHYTFFPGERWIDIIQPVTDATLDWQIAWNIENPQKPLAENGQLDQATLDAFKTKGFDPTGKSIDWNAKDHAEFKAIRNEETAARKQAAEGGGNTAFALRQQIVGLAQSQVGTVFASNRGDGRKHGWERILRYYEVAFAGTMVNTEQDKKKPAKMQEYFPYTFGPNTEDLADKKPTDPTLSQAVKDTMTPNKFSFPNPGGPWSWCAIFAMWAIRAVTGKGRWDGKVNDLEWVADPKLKNAKRGDLLYVKSDNQHHCILADEPDPAQPDGPYDCIEGNLEGQEIRRTKRWVSANLHGYYRAVPLDSSM